MDLQLAKAEKFKLTFVSKIKFFIVGIIKSLKDIFVNQKYDYLYYVIEVVKEAEAKDELTGTQKAQYVKDKLLNSAIEYFTLLLDREMNLMIEQAVEIIGEKSEGYKKTIGEKSSQNVIVEN